MLLKGTGDLKGSSTGSKNIEFTFVEKKEKIFILLTVLNTRQASKKSSKYYHHTHKNRTDEINTLMSSIFMSTTLFPSSP